jgi:hypothetical protein
VNEQSEPYRTKTGRVLTERELDALVAEAERGYDVDKLARRPGRPRLGAAPAAVVPVRLHAELHSKVKLQAAAESTSLSDLVRRALVVYLDSRPPRLEDERTRSGRVLSSSELDALASEAETGYHPEVLRSKPARHRARTEVVPVRLPPELKVAVERQAELEATSVSDIIRSALRMYLDAPEPDLPTSPRKSRSPAHRPTEARMNVPNPNRMAVSSNRPARIFISYRRADASWPGRWLTDRLVDQFGPGVVFQDVESIRPGDDFAAEIEAGIGSCSVLLAVIGPRWLAEKSDGGRRIDDPQDWVRLEIETALSREVLIVPVLVDGARMPSASELPPSLKSLAGRQAVTLSPASFDTRRLASVLEAVLAQEGKPAG